VKITRDMIARAGAGLIDQGKMQEVLAALKSYGVAAITQLRDDQMDAFGADLRALGANI
jgi:ABC-type hemin transport system substrate-binding protein